MVYIPSGLALKKKKTPYLASARNISTPNTSYANNPQLIAPAPKKKAEPLVISPPSGPPRAQDIRTFSRAAGTSPDKNIETTNLSYEEKQRISKIHGIAGKALQEAEDTQAAQSLVADIIKERRQAEFGEELKKLKEPTEAPARKLLEKPVSQDVGEVVSAGFGGVAAGAVAPALAGLSATGAGLPLAIGAGLLAFGTKLSHEQKQDVKNANTLAETSFAEVGNAINLANSGGSPAMAIQHFREQRANILLAHRKLTEKANSNLNYFTSNTGQDELIRVQALVDDLGRQQQLLEMAILNPNPKAVVNYNLFNSEEQ